MVHSRDQSNIEDRLRQMRVKMSHRGAEHGDILRQTLIGIQKTAIEITDFVIDLVLEVLAVSKVCQPRFESQTKIALEESDHRVNEGCWNCY